MSFSVWPDQCSSSTERPVFSHHCSQLYRYFTFHRQTQKAARKLFHHMNHPARLCFQQPFSKNIALMSQTGKRWKPGLKLKDYLKCSVLHVRVSARDKTTGVFSYTDQARKPQTKKDRALCSVATSVLGTPPPTATRHNNACFKMRILKNSLIYFTIQLQVHWHNTLIYTSIITLHITSTLYSHRLLWLKMEVHAGGFSQSFHPSVHSQERPIYCYSQHPPWWNSCDIHWVIQ